MFGFGRRIGAALTATLTAASATTLAATLTLTAQVAPAQAATATTVTGWVTTPLKAAVGYPVSVPITIKTGEAYAARKVLVQRRPAASSVWTTLSTVTSADTGKVTLTYGVAAVGTWAYRAYIAPEGNAGGLYTPERSVRAVKGLPTTATGWSATALSAAAPTAVRVSMRIKTGTVYVARKVLLQRRPMTSPTWSTIATVASTKTGLANLTFTLSQVGRWSYRAYVVPGVSGAGYLTPARAITSLQPATLVSGAWHSCARGTGGIVKCWGSNSFGELGDGTTTNTSTPVLVSGLTDVAALAAGRLHTCALLGSGVVRCWGDNASGQLGDDTTSASNVPVVVGGLTGVTAISAGSAHSCALLTDGTVRCWGSNSSGQLGTGDTVPSRTPVRVDGLTGVQAIGAGYAHTCALLRTGTVSCWGYNATGELGRGSLSESEPTAAPVRGLAGATSLAVGDDHACAVTTSDTVSCWGYGQYGGLGNGESLSSSHPVQVATLPDLVAVSASSLHTCALTRTGMAKCWGSGWAGQLGYGGVIDVRNVPIAVAGLTDAIAIAAGGSHSCALRVDSSVTCWGSNWYGELGDGTTDNSNVPVPVIGLP